MAAVIGCTTLVAVAGAAKAPAPDFLLIPTGARGHSCELGFVGTPAAGALKTIENLQRHSLFG
jgi:hypothetical protein